MRVVWENPGADGRILRTTRLRVLLADEHVTIRQGLRLLLEARGNLEVVADVGTGAEAVEAARSLNPDVVVLDVDRPGRNGMATVRAIRQHLPHVRIVVLTSHVEGTGVQEALTSGVSAYVLKQSSSDRLLKAVMAASVGALYVDDAVRMTRESDEQAPHRGRTSVSAREMSVLELAATGMCHKDIAAALGIAVKTVEVHKANAMRKLKLQDRSAFIAFAIIKGWFRDP